MFLAIPIFLEFVNNFYPYFVISSSLLQADTLSLVYNKKTPGLFTGSSKIMNLLLQCVCSFYELAHGPYCAYIEVVVKNHDVGILVFLE